MFQPPSYRYGRCSHFIELAALYGVDAKIGTHIANSQWAVYEVNTSRRRWALYDHKRSDEVGRFMRQIRCWYPEPPVWLALDRNLTHPCKSG